MNWPARWKWAVMLLVAALCAPAAQARGPQCPTPFLAMTYNIRLDTPADGENGWAHRRDFLAGQILVLRPALLGMQEVLPNQRTELAAVLTGYDFIGGGRDDGALVGEASPIAVDRRLFRITASGTFWLSPTPDVPSLGWDAAYRRIASWAHLRRRQDGARLLVINTHWDHQGQLARENSGLMLAEWIAANRQPDEEVLLMGDFNTIAADPAISALLTDATGLQDTRETAVLGSSGPAFSFNGFSPMPESGLLIDHLFATGGMEVIKHMVIAEHSDGRVPSDHFPVVALLGLTTQRQAARCRQ